jgi:protein-serine/threonine kinase
MASMRYSGPDVKDPGIHVGTLSLWDPTSHQTTQPVELYSNEEVFIGRDAKRW